MLLKNCRLCGGEFMYVVKGDKLYRSCPNPGCLNHDRLSVVKNKKVTPVAVEYNEASIKTIVAQLVERYQVNDVIISFHSDVIYNNVKHMTKSSYFVSNKNLHICSFDSKNKDVVEVLLNEIADAIIPDYALVGWNLDYSSIHGDELHCIYNSSGGELSKTIIYKVESDSLTTKLLQFYEDNKHKYKGWSISQSATSLIIQVGSADSVTFFVFTVSLIDDTVSMQKIMPEVTAKVLDDSAVNPEDAKLAEIILLKILELKGELNDSSK